MTISLGGRLRPPGGVLCTQLRKIGQLRINNRSDSLAVASYGVRTVADPPSFALQHGPGLDGWEERPSFLAIVRE